METTTIVRGKHRGYLTTRRDDEQLAALSYKIAGVFTPGAGKRKAVAS